MASKYWVMGTDIPKSRFTETDFKTFQRNLQAETDLLGRWIEEDRFDHHSRALGLELETCLVDDQFLPAPQNERLLEKVQDPMLVPELSQFNAELNTPAHALTGPCLKKIHSQLKEVWTRVQKACADLKIHMVMTGCLPTLKDEMLTLQYMSNLDRFRALNEQIMSLRHGLPVRIHIQGYDTLDVTHHDVMLEAATTSMQIHLQVESKKIVRHFNAAMIASAPMTAVSANSPFLFEKSLWEETRIPVFEQAVNLPGFLSGDNLPPRVGFGSSYLKKSFLELFRENLAFPVLLPIHYQEGEEAFEHLRLHNGTIWRWNRPIIGIAPSQKPHFRVEHRVCPAGPTLIDIVANLAFFLGLVHSWATQKEGPEKEVSVEDARENFYAAAHWGIASSVKGLHPKERHMQTLLLKYLIPLAKKGLQDLKIDEEDIHLYLDEVMTPRVKTAQTGSHWQRSFIHKNGPDFQNLTKNYFQFQEQDLPVHEWTL